MKKAESKNKQPSFLKKTKKELAKSLFYFSAGAIATGILMVRNKCRQNHRKKLEKSLEEKDD